MFYNHLYYWDFESPTGVNVSGNHIGNLTVNYHVPGFDNLNLSAQVKNLWDEDELYPINATGSSAGAGAPAVESRSYWLNLDFKF